MQSSVQTLSLNKIANLTDGELVIGSIAGRNDSFEEIVRRYQRPIAAYVYRMVGNYESALDLTQDVFIKVYNSLARYSSEYKFSTWIYKIAHNASIDYLRRASNREHSLLIESDGETFERPILSSKLTPEQESERRERREELETIIKNLPSAYRELIVLRHSLDMSYDEIADITGLPLGTVKNRLFRAREMMRDVLIQRGITQA